jgi:thioredoxin 1
MSRLVNNITDADFDAAIAAPGPVLVDFYGDDCTKCEHLARVLDDLAPAMAGDVSVNKLYLSGPDSAVAGKLAIRGIPTLILFVDGEPVARQTGVISQQDVLAMVAPHRSGKTAV